MRCIPDSKIAAHWRKPEFAHKLECLWVIGGRAPLMKIGNLFHSDFTARISLDLAFDEDERSREEMGASRYGGSSAR
ncbi:MAG: hypothetical protein LBK73_03875 [Treponema sp.]|jgi:hypothetical protein|nr:hypothetical protein [Treponema sp.]